MHPVLPCIIAILTFFSVTTTSQEDFTKKSPPPVSAEARSEMETKLKEAQANYEANPKSADAMIWVGRRLAYLGRFTEASISTHKVSNVFPMMRAFTGIAATVRSRCDVLIARSLISRRLRS